MINPIYYPNPDEIERIQAVPHFSASAYGNLDIAATLDFFYRRYVAPLANLVDIEKCMVVDCGCGYGWFTIAYLLAGGKAAIAVDLENDRLQAAGRIMEILSLGDRVQLINSAIEEIPLTTDETDIFVSIETLEHIGKRNIPIALQRICDVTSRSILITTPNRLFPVIAHDTRLPFIQWLPPHRRKYYAEIFGRLNKEHGNDFLSPSDFEILQDKFRVVSSCLTFQNFQEYWDHFPYYSPYGADGRKRLQTHPSPLKASYFWLASKVLGRHSYWGMPSLASIFVRR